MLQQVMTNPGEIIFREVLVPEAKHNQVLVKIMNIAVCGSDIHVYHGKHPFTKYPVTQGHEVSGEITELGKNVTEFHVGQKVTIEPQVYCCLLYTSVVPIADAYYESDNPEKVEKEWKIMRKTAERRWPCRCA